MIEIRGLTKTFKKRVTKKHNKFEKIIAIDNMNLHIDKGEILVLLGQMALVKQPH